MNESQNKLIDQSMETQIYSTSAIYDGKVSHSTLVDKFSTTSENEFIINAPKENLFLDVKRLVTKKAHQTKEFGLKRAIANCILKINASDALLKEVNVNDTEQMLENKALISIHSIVGAKQLKEILREFSFALSKNDLNHTMLSFPPNIYFLVEENESERAVLILKSVITEARCTIIRALVTEESENNLFSSFAEPSKTNYFGSYSINIPAQRNFMHTTYS